MNESHPKVIAMFWFLFVVVLVCVAILFVIKQV